MDEGSYGVSGRLFGMVAIEIRVSWGGGPLEDLAYHSLHDFANSG